MKTTLASWGGVIVLAAFIACLCAILIEAISAPQRDFINSFRAICPGMLRSNVEDLIGHPDGKANSVPELLHTMPDRSGIDRIRIPNGGSASWYLAKKAVVSAVVVYDKDNRVLEVVFVGDHWVTVPTEKAIRGGREEPDEGVVPTEKDFRWVKPGSEKVSGTFSGE